MSSENKHSVSPTSTSSSPSRQNGSGSSVSGDNNAQNRRDQHVEKKKNRNNDNNDNDDNNKVPLDSKVKKPRTEQPSSPLAQNSSSPKAMAAGKTKSRNNKWDLESALHFVVNSWTPPTPSSTSSATDTTTTTSIPEREYLWKSHCQQRPSTASSSVSKYPQQQQQRQIGPDIDTPPWITFRMGHAGDVCEVARLWRRQQQEQKTTTTASLKQPQLQQQLDETTSLEVRLAEGLGSDEDHPPVLFCLLAHVHQLHHGRETEEEVTEGHGNHTKTSLVAAVLLTEQLDAGHHENESPSNPQQQQQNPFRGRILRVEWMFLDKEKMAATMQPIVESRLWLRLCSVALLLESRIVVVNQSEASTTATTNATHTQAATTPRST